MFIRFTFKNFKMSFTIHSLILAYSEVMSIYVWKFWKIIRHALFDFSIA